MKEYQLCRSRTAEHPFYIESIDTNIYTIEELCFYFHQNLCLLDDTVLNEKLCVWLQDELGMERLGRRIREKIEAGTEPGNIVLAVLKETGYLRQGEYRRVQEQIARLEVQPQDIRRKIRGDYLVNYGMYSRAVNTYRSILEEKSEGNMGLQFYASVLNNMAAAYARMFLFAEAAECLWESYGMVRSNAIYRRYLAVLPYFLSKEEYKKRIAELRIPEEQLQSIEEEKKEALAAVRMQPLLQDAGYEELEKFVGEEKMKYYKSRR